LQNGDGVDGDMREAARNYKMAMDQGNEDAVRGYERCLDDVYRGEIAGMVIDLSDYEQSRNIREIEEEQGNRSVVSFVQHRRTGEEVVVKTFIVPETADEEEVQRKFNREVVSASTLIHPCIVGVKGCCLSAETEGPKIITEYVGGGTLKEFLKKDGPEIEWWDDTGKTIAVAGIVHAMKLIQRKGLVHGNLNPSNILFDEYHRPKICDFGTRRIYSVTTGNEVSIYAASGVRDEEYDGKTDVYSFGLILFEIVTGHGVFSNCDMAGRVRWICRLQNGTRLDVPEAVFPQTRDLIEKCWSKEASTRPSFDEVWKSLKENGFRILPGVDREAVEAFIGMLEKV
jgi:serine/threonine protein kinase